MTVAVLTLLLPLCSRLQYEGESAQTHSCAGYDSLRFPRHGEGQVAQIGAANKRDIRPEEVYNAT